MPEQLSKLTVIYSGMKYKVGIGGLHSQEKKTKLLNQMMINILVSLMLLQCTQA